VQLRFIAPERLSAVLKRMTPSGDRSVNTNFWTLRMEALRIMHHPGEFELVALDYCVTYEVSPPSWEAARCACKAVSPEGGYVSGNSPSTENFYDSVPSRSSSGFGDNKIFYGDSGTTLPVGAVDLVGTVDLVGSIQGDATLVLQGLDQRLGDAKLMIISCARLIRMDFSAAGMMLNWVNARSDQGRQIHFSDTHRLVAAFFSVIGIGEHARVFHRAH
jgi:hypothetical protein